MSKLNYISNLLHFLDEKIEILKTNHCGSILVEVERTIHPLL